MYLGRMCHKRMDAVCLRLRSLTIFVFLPMKEIYRSPASKIKYLSENNLTFGLVISCQLKLSIGPANMFETAKLGVLPKNTNSSHHLPNMAYYDTPPETTAGAAPGTALQDGTGSFPGEGKALRE